MKRFSVTQSRWLWKGLTLAVILSGILAVIFFPSPRPESSHDQGGIGHLAVTKETLTQPEPRAASLTSREMDAYLDSLRNASPPRDPFLSSGEDDWKKFLHDLKGRPPRLEGIIRVGSARVAIINHSRFREGEEVEGFQILKIGEKDVMLSKNGSICRVHIIQ